MDYILESQDMPPPILEIRTELEMSSIDWANVVKRGVKESCVVTNCWQEMCTYLDLPNLENPARDGLLADVLLRMNSRERAIRIAEKIKNQNPDFNNFRINKLLLVFEDARTNAKALDAFERMLSSYDPELIDVKIKYLRKK